MTTQAQTTLTEQDLDLASIHAFCDELEAYLRTGVLPVLVDTYKGVQTFHVIRPQVINHPCGDRKITGKISRTPQGFEHMIGQQHSLSLLL